MPNLHTKFGGGCKKKGHVHFRIPPSSALSPEHNFSVLIRHPGATVATPTHTFKQLVFWDYWINATASLLSDHEIHTQTNLIAETRPNIMIFYIDNLITISQATQVQRTIVL